MTRRVNRSSAGQPVRPRRSPLAGQRRLWLVDESQVHPRERDLCISGHKVHVDEDDLGVVDLFEEPPGPGPSVRTKTKPARLDAETLHTVMRAHWHADRRRAARSRTD